MLYGIITVAAQQMSAAIVRTIATAEWPRETMLLNISSLWKTRLKPRGGGEMTALSQSCVGVAGLYLAGRYRDLAAEAQKRCCG